MVYLKKPKRITHIKPTYKMSSMHTNPMYKSNIKSQLYELRFLYILEIYLLFKP